MWSVCIPQSSEVEETWEEMINVRGKGDFPHEKLNHSGLTGGLLCLGLNVLSSWLMDATSAMRTVNKQNG